MNTYIMRWNPNISSATIEDIRNAREQFPDGFNFNWSIYEWEHAQEGDDFFMVRVGEGINGVVAIGNFISAPYEGDDWANVPGKKRHYVDICVPFSCDPDEPLISIEQLQELIPEIDWLHGHSGVKLTKEQADKLHEAFPLI